MASDFGASLVRFNARDLTEANQKIARAGKKRIDRAFRNFVSEGVMDGSIKPCDVKLTTFAIVGSLNWIGHWFKPDGALSAETIASKFSVQLTHDLEKGRTAKKATKKKA